MKNIKQYLALCLILISTLQLKAQFVQNEFVMGLYSVPTDSFVNACHDNLSPPIDRDNNAVPYVRGSINDGYLSSFNVIENYLMSGFDDPDLVSYINHVYSYGLKPVITIPLWDYDQCGQPPEYPDSNNFMDGDFDIAYSMIEMLENSTFGVSNKFYGYTIDEPGGLAKNVMSRAIEADRLIEFYNFIKGSNPITDKPVIISMPHYSAHSISGNLGLDYWPYNKNKYFIGTNYSTGVRHYIGDSSSSLRSDFDNGVLEILEDSIYFETDTNYNGSHDILINDTYLFGATDTNSIYFKQFDSIIGNIFSPVSNFHAAINTSLSEWNGTMFEDIEKVNDYFDIRFFSYSALIHGAKGVWFYGLADSYTAAEGTDSKRWGEGVSNHYVNTLVPLSNELSYVGDRIVGGTIIGQRIWGSSNGHVPTLTALDGSVDPLHVLVVEDNSELLILVANVSNNRVDYSMNLNSLKTSSLVSNSIKSVIENTELFELLFTSKHIVEPESLKIAASDYVSSPIYLSDNHISSPIRLEGGDVNVFRIKDVMSTDYSALVAESEMDYTGHNLYELPTPLHAISTTNKINLGLKYDDYAITGITEGHYSGDTEDITRVFAFFNGDSTIVATADVTNSIIDEIHTANDGFHVTGLATGDINGDGYDDLLVIMVNHSSLNQKRWWIYGGSTGLSSTLGTPSNISYWMATSAVFSNTQNDSEDQVLIGETTENEWETGLGIYDNSGLISTPYQRSGTANDGFYISSLASGDLDGDDVDDLIVVFNHNSGEGHKRFEWLTTENGNNYPSNYEFHTLSPTNSSTYWGISNAAIVKFIEGLPSTKYYAHNVVGWHVTLESWFLGYGNQLYSQIGNGGKYFNVIHQAKRTNSISKSVSRIPTVGNLASPAKPSVVVYPNPFNSSTTVTVNIDNRSEVKISVYDLLGRLISETSDYRDAGYHNFRIDMKNLATGVYVLKVFSNGQVESKTITLLR